MSQLTSVVSPSKCKIQIFLLDSFLSLSFLSGFIADQALGREMSTYGSPGSIEEKLIAFNPEIYVENSDLPCQGVWIRQKEIKTTVDCAAAIRHKIDQGLIEVFTFSESVGYVGEVVDNKSQIGELQLVPWGLSDHTMNTKSVAYDEVQEAFRLYSLQNNTGGYVVAGEKVMVTGKDTEKYFFSNEGSSIAAPGTVISSDNKLLCVVNGFGNECLIPKLNQISERRRVRRQGERMGNCASITSPVRRITYTFCFSFDWVMVYRSDDPGSSEGSRWCSNIFEGKYYACSAQAELDRVPDRTDTCNQECPELGCLITPDNVICEQLSSLPDNPSSSSSLIDSGKTTESFSDNNNSLSGDSSWPWWGITILAGGLTTLVVLPVLGLSVMGSIYLRYRHHNDNESLLNADRSNDQEKQQPLEGGSRVNTPEPSVPPPSQGFPVGDPPPYMASYGQEESVVHYSAPTETETNVSPINKHQESLAEPAVIQQTSPVVNEQALNPVDPL